MMLPETGGPVEGDVMMTVGGEVSFFLTETVTLLEVVAFPAASRARAVRVWEPFRTVVVSQETE